MNGNESFIFDGKELDYKFIDFWRFHFSNIYDIQGRIAEFIVAKALGINESQNDQYWTLWDLSYRDIRIEVKETSYYHSFNKDGKISKQRIFGIPKANGEYDFEVSGNKEFRRQNNVYVFCLNIGETKEDSYPLNLNNWEFYIVPTEIIDEKCGNNKTISLGRIKSLGFSAVRFNEIKAAIDLIADKILAERKNKKEFSKDDIIKAHLCSSNNMSELKKPQKCGCFCCLEIFDSSDNIQYLIDDNSCDHKGTALCPKCGIDSVIGESSGYPITKEFLSAMHEYWF